MSYTSDPNDPRLTHGPDAAPTEQAPVYLVLSEAERRLGLVRPLRYSYVHVGPNGSPARLTDRGCGTQTHMGLALCETYARDPGFYGSTYCVGCRMHLPVAEFVWAEDGQVVGS